MDRPNKIFDTRIRSANIARRNLPYVKVSENDKQHMVNSLFGRATQNPNRLIYIHIPFCRQICPFCIYQKQKTDDINLISDYFDVLTKQIQALSSTSWADSASFKAVYFGGGTPTSVPVEYLESILNELKKNYRLADDCEITIESTIADINPAMVSRLKNAGVNRISLGVQSFNSQVREKLGRRATQEQIAETVMFIYENGISNICVDLMYNLEQQNFETWQNDLSFLKTIPISGCSVYPLVTPANRSNPHVITQPESQETESLFFLEADNRLIEDKNWMRFTPVQYGHRENGKAIYVRGQGQNADLLAFGSGSAGRIGNFNYLQTGEIQEFINGKGDLKNDFVTFMSIDKSYLSLRNIYRLSESLSLYKTDYQLIKEYFDDIVRQLISDGLVDSGDNSYFLTQAGRFWAANISALFTERIMNLILKMGKQS